MGISGVILKVFLVSLGVSVAIKYGGPLLNVPTSDPIALVAILLPAVLIGVLLVVRGKLYSDPRLNG